GYRRVFHQARLSRARGLHGARDHHRDRRSDPADHWLENTLGGLAAFALRAHRRLRRAPLLASRRRSVREPDEPLHEEPGDHRRAAVRRDVRPWQRVGRQALTARPDASLIAALERSHVHPLWDRYKRITPVAPQAKDAPMHWRWRDIEPFTARAAEEVGIEDVERRALILANPAFGGETVTTHNLIGAFTVLEPGDKAVPHRHSAAAIRFSTRAEGAVTIVNGRRCEMHEGDLVLTPPMCWHGHINEGTRRTVWFDAANMPAICMLDASFFEPGLRQDERFWDVGAEGSAEYRFPGDEARRALAGAPRAADG